MFLSELCDTLGVARPDPSGSERDYNDYVFERAVRPRDGDGTAPKRIDLYKKDAFVLVAKQSRLADEPAVLGKRNIARGWDVMMKNARQQAETYVFLLDANHPAPPFIIVCDVGHCLELFPTSRAPAAPMAISRTAMATASISRICAGKDPRASQDDLAST